MGNETFLVVGLARGNSTQNEVPGEMVSLTEDSFRRMNMTQIILESEGVAEWLSGNELNGFCCSALVY